MSNMIPAPVLAASDAPQQLQAQGSAGGEQLRAQARRGAQPKAAGGGPIRARNEKPNHRFSSHLPNRPKKAASPYTLFIQGYYARNKNSKLSAKEKFIQAANEWKKISKSDREELEKVSARDRQRYEREMSIWKTQKDFLKRPPTNYGLFLRETWTKEKAAGRGYDDFEEISKETSERWADMSRKEKQKYTDQSNTLRENYQGRVQEIRSTGSLPALNWSNRSVVMSYTPSQVQLQAAPAPGQADDEEYDDGDDEDEEEDDYEDDE